MTAAEQKFRECDGSLHRAQGLLRVLRAATEGGLKGVDDAMWGGVYSIICDVEEAIDAAATTWREGHELTRDAS